MKRLYGMQTYIVLLASCFSRKKGLLNPMVFQKLCQRSVTDQMFPFSVISVSQCFFCFTKRLFNEVSGTGCFMKPDWSKCSGIFQCILRNNCQCVFSESPFTSGKNIDLTNAMYIFSCVTMPIDVEELGALLYNAL